MFKISNSDPYSELICRWFQKGFPKVFKPSTAELLEILYSILVSTKENRLGPAPKPEHAIVIRETIRKAIELGVPIPVLVPWGGRKGRTGYSYLDMAEVSGILQIVGLCNAIKQFYAPGLHVHIALENVGAYWLYRTDPLVTEETNAYTKDMCMLVDMLKGDTLIKAIPESMLMNPERYFKSAEKYSEYIEEVIKLSLTGISEEEVYNTWEYQELKALGWHGTFPLEQTNYYIERYRSVNPHLSLDHYILMLADYFGGAKARYDLGGKGEPESPVGSYIKLSFVPPVPGAPTSLTNNTLYWRTIPASESRNHIAPWRAKGYLHIEDDLVTPKVMSFNDSQLADLTKSITKLTSSDSETLSVSTDYIVQDSIIPLPVALM